MPRRDASGDVRESEEDRGYLIYLEYHAARHRSDVVVLDAADVAGKELARVELPFHVPHTFHGTFRDERAARGEGASGEEKERTRRAESLGQLDGESRDR